MLIALGNEPQELSYTREFQFSDRFTAKQAALGEKFCGVDKYTY
jgi:hypothetical protein